MIVHRRREPVVGVTQQTRYPLPTYGSTARSIGPENPYSIDPLHARYWHLADIRLVHCTCLLLGVKRTLAASTFTSDF